MKFALSARRCLENFKNETARRYAEAYWASFWSHVDRETGPVHPRLGRCWLWTAAVTKAGYGTVRFCGRATPASRVAMILTIGDSSKWALHKCDNQRCCRPSHLQRGTHAENMRQMKERGRAVGHAGETNGNAKLTRAQAQYIRTVFAGVDRPYQRSSKTYRQVADELGVSLSLVALVARGKAWRHEI